MHDVLCKNITVFFIIKLTNNHDRGKNLECVMFLIIIYVFYDIKDFFAVDNSCKHN